MGVKSITCPKCGKNGTLSVENRISKKSKKSNWEIWIKFKRKNPKLSNADLIPKIIHSFENYLDLQEWLIGLYPLSIEYPQLDQHENGKVEYVKDLLESRRNWERVKQNNLNDFKEKQ